MAFAEFMGQVYNVPAVNLDESQPDPDAVCLIPSEVATKFQVVPVRRQGRVLTVAMANPDNIFCHRRHQVHHGARGEAVVAPESAIKKAIDRLYDSADSLASVMKDMQEDFEIVDDAAEELSKEEVEPIDAPVVKLVNSLIADAVGKHASDIHIEPYEKQLRVATA